MTITIRLRRPARRSIAIFVAGLLFGIPAVALANHQFPDVPAAHPFHGEIGAIAEAGITAGFNDGGYHPSDAVTRQAMAAFMHRGFGRVGLALGSTPVSPVTVAAGAYSGDYVTVRVLMITVPGENNAFGPNQLVHLQGHVAFETAMSNADKGCPCEFEAVIRDTTSGTTSRVQQQTFDNSVSTTAFGYSFDTEGLFTASPGSRTYVLEVKLTGRQDPTNAASFSLSFRSTFSAMTFPFGPAGTNDL